MFAKLTDMLVPVAKLWCIVSDGPCMDCDRRLTFGRNFSLTFFGLRDMILVKLINVSGLVLWDRSQFTLLFMWMTDLSPEIQSSSLMILRKLSLVNSE